MPESTGSPDPTRRTRRPTSLVHCAIAVLVALAACSARGSGPSVSQELSAILFGQGSARDRSTPKDTAPNAATTVNQILLSRTT